MKCILWNGLRHFYQMLSYCCCFSDVLANWPGIQILNRQGLMDCASRDWQICQNYKQSATNLLENIECHPGMIQALKALSLGPKNAEWFLLFQIMSSIMGWVARFQEWLDLQGGWALESPKCWCGATLQLSGWFFSVPNYFAGCCEDPDTAMRQQLRDYGETIWQNVGESHHGEMWSHLWTNIGWMRRDK